MTKHDITDMFPIGTLVDVHDNPYCRGFTGTVVDYHPALAGRHEALVTVRDQDDNHYDYFLSEVSVSSPSHVE